MTGLWMAVGAMSANLQWLSVQMPFALSFFTLQIADALEGGSGR